MDRIVQYLVINREILALGPGVVAAQAAHAAVAGYLVAAITDAARFWAEGTFTKVILAVDDEAALRRLAEELAGAGIAHRVLEESRLQGKATAIGLAPMSRSIAAPVVGRLALLK
jgi:peptidyl-tRNA hydrolase